MQENRDRAIGAFLSISLILLATGCPFEEKLYGAGSPGVGGAGGQPADTQTVTTGASGSGGETIGTSSGGSGGSGGAENGIVCPVADDVADPSDGNMLTPYLFEIASSKSCYALYIDKFKWQTAKSLCESLTSDGSDINARLVAISNVDEHTKIRDWLLDLRKNNPNTNFGGPWTRGIRNPFEPDPIKIGAFAWAADSAEIESEPWLIFPCGECGKGNTRENFWGTRNDDPQQPDYVPPYPGVVSWHCVRYGISDSWMSGTPGLADDKCSDERPFICEWQAP